MSHLHREKTPSVTQEYSRRHEKATLQSGANLVATQGRAPIGHGQLAEALSQSASTSCILPPSPLRSNLGNLSMSV
jgi:hypothetical protein